jgi:hypothetical protein
MVDEGVVTIGFDSHAYWGAWRFGLYDAPPLAQDAYLYSPAFAQVLWPLAALPWPAFQVAWILVSCLCFAWLLRPVPVLWAIPVWILCVPEILAGNVYAQLAVVLVLGVRHPAVWAFSVLTKVLPAGVGLLWFLARGQFRQAGVILASAAAVAALSALFAPGLWLDWVQFLVLSGHTSEAAHRTPYFLRLAAGACLVVFAAWTDRPWLTAPALVLLSPTIGPNPLTVLAAIPRLRGTTSLPSSTVSSQATRTST